jgi:hypothetical protein
MIHPRTLQPRMLRLRVIRPRTRMLYLDVFLSLYVSSLKELGGSKQPLTFRYVPIRFIPKEKGCIFEILFPDIFSLKITLDMVNHNQLNSTNPWIGWACCLI